MYRACIYKHVYKYGFDYQYFIGHETKTSTHSTVSYLFDVRSLMPVVIYFFPNIFVHVDHKYSQIDKCPNRIYFFTYFEMNEK